MCETLRQVKRRPCYLSHMREYQISPRDLVYKVFVYNRTVCSIMRNWIVINPFPFQLACVISSPLVFAEIRGFDLALIQIY